MLIGEATRRHATIAQALAAPEYSVVRLASALGVEAPLVQRKLEPAVVPLYPFPHLSSSRHLSSHQNSMILSLVFLCCSEKRLYN